MRKLLIKIAATCLLAGANIGLAGASLTTFQTWVGNVGYSSDGFGSTTNQGTISASVPLGSTVIAAYLYTSYFDSPPTPTATLNGVNAVFGPNVPNTTCCGLGSARADVTGIVKPIIDAGAGGIYNFAITEGLSQQDGEALVVVYSNAALPVSTFGILDGFASVVGDAATINFSHPLDPTQPGFFAEMFVAVNFSCCVGPNALKQYSTIMVNGSTVSAQAGNNDDSIDAIEENGNLITVGGFNDPFSPTNPTYDNDHERYNLASFVTPGDTSINVVTSNDSRDDNLFLAGFYVFGSAGVNAPPPSPTTTVPEPSSLALLGIGLAGFAAARRRKAA